MVRETRDLPDNFIVIIPLRLDLLFIELLVLVVRLGRSPPLWEPFLSLLLQFLLIHI